MPHCFDLAIILPPLFVTALFEGQKMRHSYLDYMQRILDAGDWHLDGLITPLSQAEVRAIQAEVRAIKKTLRLPEIVNEANLTGGENIGSAANLDAGENVGGSTAAPAAPEVAGDDDDGDGDGDPDPDRRPKRRSTRSSSSTLPPAQLSRPKAACALLGIGRTKLHHLSERDPRFPRKIVLGPRCVGWRTDALLDYLRLCEQEA